MLFNTAAVAFLFFCVMALVPHGGALAAGEPPAAARVNGVAITEQEVQEATERLIPSLTYHGNISEDSLKAFRERALDTLIAQELIYQSARERGLEADKGQVGKQFDKIRDQFKSKKEYRQALDQSGITEKQLKARIARDVLIGMAFHDSVTEPSRMSEEALKDYYGKNIEKFKQPESIRLRIISAKEEKKAQDALSKITAGEDFGAVAARMSEDSYRIKGGDVGDMHRGRLQPELEEVAFALKAGERSGLIRAQGIWYILKVEEIKAARQRTFEESKNTLKTDLERKTANELKEKWIARLKEKAKIEIFIKAADDNQLNP